MTDVSIPFSDPPNIPMDPVPEVRKVNRPKHIESNVLEDLIVNNEDYSPTYSSSVPAAPAHTEFVHVMDNRRLGRLDVQSLVARAKDQIVDATPINPEDFDPF